MGKYKLTDETIEVDGRTLHRIQALVDFSNVKAGELGGYIENEYNLSQFGGAWVYNNAMVYDKARVFGDAKICNNSRVLDSALVCDSATIAGNANVLGRTKVSDSSCVTSNAVVCDRARISGYTIVLDNAIVGNSAIVSGQAELGRDADVKREAHYVAIENIGSRYDTTTFYRNKNNGISVECGYFNGTIDEFRKAVKECHKENKHARVYELACALAEEQIEDVYW